MKPSRRSVGVLVVGTLAVLAAGYLAVIVRRPSGVLPDGSRVTLLDFRYQDGYRHSMDPPRWVRRIGEHLPLRYRGQLARWFPRGGALQVSPVGHPRLFLATRQGARPLNGAVDLQRLWVRDPDASWFEAVSDALTVGWPDARDQVWPLEAFPRRAPFLTVRLVGPDETGLFRNGLEFRIPNPTPGPFPVWTPEPLPAARTNGDLRVTLTDFVTGIDRYRDGPDAGNDFWRDRRTTRATLELPEKVPWEVRSLEVSDATGNRWEPGLQDSKGTELAPNLRAAEFIGALWPSEPVWNLRFELARTNAFEPDELGEMEIPAPSENEWRLLQETREIAGVKVTVVGVGGASANLPRPFGDLRSGNGPGLAIRAEAKAQERRVRVAGAVDDRGLAVEVAEGLRWLDAEQFVGLTIPDGAHSLRLVLAAPRSRFVEFRVSPRRTEASTEMGTSSKVAR